MTLALAVPAAIGAAVAFGSASALQHSAAHLAGGAGRVDLAGLGRLLGDGRWLLGLLGDALGLGLLVVALGAGPVSVVQPLQVLSLLIALPVGGLLGGAHFTRTSVTAAVVVVLSVAAVLALAGDPGQGHAPGTRSAVLVSGVVLAVVIVGLGITRGASAPTRAAVHGLTSGTLFAVTAVLLRSVALTWQRSGLAGMGGWRGLLPLLCLLVVGAAAVTVGQAGFQVGPLAASLPAQTAADPLVAVGLGVTVLGEHVHTGNGALVGYACALVAVVLAARALVRPPLRGAVDAHR